MTKLNDILDSNKLKQEISQGYISKRKHPTLPLFIYNYTNKATFEHKWSHEIKTCRGLITDEEGNILGRSFYKFFNLGQSEGVSFEDAQRLLSFGYSYELTDKMDGWLGVGYKYNGEWAVSSRGSFDSEGSRFATEKFQKIVKAERDHVFPPSYTPVFEIIFKKGQIVIPYDYEGLVLLALVDNDTGYELPYEMLYKVWKKMNMGFEKPLCRLVEKVDKSIDVAMSEDIAKKEGYVITLSHPHEEMPIKAKIKFDEYCRLHRILTGITGNQIHDALANPLKGYLESDVPKEFKGWVKSQADEYYKQFWAIMEDVRAVGAHYLWELYSATKQEDENPKKFAFLSTKEQYPELVNFAVLYAEGKIRELHEAIWKSFKPHGVVKPYYEEGAKE
jgi:RNA ligase